MNRIPSAGVAVVCIVLGAAVALAQQDEIRKSEAAWVSAITKNDLAALERMLADDLVYTHGSGLVETKTQYIEALRSGNQKYASVEHNDVKITNLGNAAVVTARVRMTGSTKGQPFDNQLRMLHVWAKRNGQWQLLAHQTTRLP